MAMLVKMTLGLLMPAGNFSDDGRHSDVSRIMWSSWRWRFQKAPLMSWS